MNDNLKNRFTPAARSVLLGVALILGASGLAWSRLAHEDDSPAKVIPLSVAVDERPIAREGKAITSFAPVVKKVTPSVVKVMVTGKAEKSPGMDNLPEEFRRFFGDSFGGGRRSGPMPRQRGLGSGVIVSKDGYILTNNHVVENADEVKVALNDGREFIAKVIGTDPKTDIAIVKVDAKDLPAINIADSDRIEVGDLALAIGNPFGVGQTVTMGMISAVGRGNLGLDYEDFIQTDAAINPGNSGGALVDAEGRLIGINTAILSRSGGNQGIGFAVPANLARSVMESLVKDGKVVRGFMGVNIQDLTPALAKEFNLKDNNGAVVSDVSPRSPAEKAGVKSGDVITAFNGKEVRDSRHLKLQVAQVHPGKTVPVKVLRDGKEKTLNVTVKELPGNELASNKGHDKDANSSDSLDGVAVGDLDGNARSQLKVPGSVKGALVTEVDPNSAAYEAGLREGDVIQEINRKPVAGAEDAVKLTEKVKDKRTLLRVWSKGGSRFMVVDENKAG
ncbi:MAG TPA: DegQ family serine endoprotease [Candidatus Saccharimonadales bacterium]|nr:DegQ family serine endoprotease [Candidatus Saccharimonadales bacterium]